MVQHFPSTVTCSSELNGQAGDGGVPDVDLIFPPLVSSSFGHYYPSTAVLSSYLDTQGITSRQIELNQRFAEFLLGPALIERLAAARVPGAGLDSVAAATARWVSRHSDDWIDPASGIMRREAFADNASVLKALAGPFLTDPGHSVLAGSFADLPVMPYYEEFFEGVHTGRCEPWAPLVGLSAPMGPQLAPTLLFAGMLKAVHPGLRIVLGGPSLSLMDDDDLETLLTHHPAVDGVVRYDGEHPLATLARQIRDGRWEPESVAGVSCLSGRRVRHNPPGVGPDINRLPRPKYSTEILERLAQPMLSITQARGCYWGKCDYCDFVELYDGSPPFRGRHPDDFVAEIEELVAEHGITRFVFITESIPPAFARRMSRLLLEHGTQISWVSFAMVDRRFDQELLELMGRAGCDHLVIGLETMTTRVLKLVHKSADREENIRFLRDAHKVGMKLRVNLIPDLPSTTYQEAMQSLADIRELVDCVDGIAVFPFEPTRSSNVGRTPERFGLVPVTQTPGTGIAQYALNHMDSVDRAMTPDERAEVHQLYQRLEDEVSAQRAAASRRGHTTATHIAPESAQLRVPIEELDVLIDGDRVVCHNMRPPRRLTLTEDAERVLRDHPDGTPFPATELAVPDLSSLPAVVDELMDAGVLAPAADVVGEAG